MDLDWLVMIVSEDKFLLLLLLDKGLDWDVMLVLFVVGGVFIFMLVL